MDNHDLYRLDRIHRAARARALELRAEAMDRAWTRIGSLARIGFSALRNALTSRRRAARAVPLPEEARLHRCTA